MSTARRAMRKINLVTAPAGVVIAVAGVALHSPVSIAFGLLAAVLGVIGIYTTRRQT